MTDIAPVEFLWALGTDMILAVSAIVGYGLLRCALITATHRFRVRTGIKADRLAADARVGSQTREQLIAMADIAYHPLAPWLVIVGVAVGLFLPRPVGRRMLEKIRLSNDPAVFKDILRLKARLCVAQVTASPLATLLATLLAVPVLLLVFCRDSVSSLRHGLERSLAAAPVPGLRWNLRAA